MKLQLVSDIHSEFWDNPDRLLERIKIIPDLDFLVLAGDTVVPSRQSEVIVKRVFQYFSERARHVIFLVGNHEFYGGSLGPVREKLAAAMPDNFVWLQNDEVTLDGVHFYGGAMWFNNADGLNGYFKRVMNDFALIEGLESWVYDDNRAFGLIGDALIRPETVVVTHHLPHMGSVPERFKKEQTNRFFVSDQTDLVVRRQPRLWLHGHTHEPCDYMLGATRVLCNPYGYPNERYKTWESELEGRGYPVVAVEV